MVTKSRSGSRKQDMGSSVVDAVQSVMPSKGRSKSTARRASSQSSGGRSQDIAAMAANFFKQVKESSSHIADKRTVSPFALVGLFGAGFLLARLIPKSDFESTTLPNAAKRLKEASMEQIRPIKEMATNAVDKMFSRDQQPMDSHI